MTTENIATMVGEMAEAIGGDFNYLMFPENSAPNPPYILFYYFSFLLNYIFLLNFYNNQTHNYNR